MHGCEVAEYLIKRGRKVTIVDTSDQLGTGMLEINRPRLLDWLAKKGAAMLTGVSYEEITDNGLRLTTGEGETVFIEADTILITTPPEPNNELMKILEGVVPEVHMVGDCKNPGQIVDAIEDGRRIACWI